MMTTPPMTDTPLTDALIKKEGAVFGPSYFREFSEHARTLERALSAEKEKVRELADLLRECLPRVGLIVITTNPPIKLPPDDLRERIEALLARLGKGE